MLRAAYASTRVRSSVGIHGQRDGRARISSRARHQRGTVAGRACWNISSIRFYTWKGSAIITFAFSAQLKIDSGSTNEIGIFEMRDHGLSEVSNPSEILLAERAEGIAGSSIVCSVEGTRPLMVEIQALVSRSSQTPARSHRH